MDRGRIQQRREDVHQLREQDLIDDLESELVHTLKASGALVHTGPKRLLLGGVPKVPERGKGYQPRRGKVFRMEVSRVRDDQRFGGI